MNTATAAVLWIGRTQERAVRWSAAAKSCGWQAQALSLIGTQALPISDSEKAMVLALGSEDCLFLTSAEAVRQFFALHTKESVVSHCPIAVVGPTTAEALRKGTPTCAGIEPAFVAPDNTGESLAAVFLASAPNPAATRIFFGAQDPSPALGAALAAAGLPLHVVSAYHVVGLKGSPPPSGELVLLFSPSGVASLRKRVVKTGDHPVLAVGPTTAAAAQQAGFPLRGVLSRPHPSALTAFLKE
jgi:uroporphyrinogen-III synthase